MKQKRNSSIELLRLVLMFLIIVHHSIIHGMGLIGMRHPNALPMHFSEIEKPTACIVNCLCICAVNCFILVSGYFSIKTNAKKFVSLILCVLFYTALFSSTYFISIGEFKKALWSMGIFSHPTYWFVSAYIYLMIFSPLINLLFTKLSFSYQIFFLISLCFISCYLGFIWENPLNLDGYNLMQFLFMYSIGRFLCLHPLHLNILQSFLLYFVPAVTAGIVMIFLWNKGFSYSAWNMIKYNNPLIILSAIGLLSLFLRFRFESMKINKWATSAFAVYMVQSSEWSQNFYYKFINWLQIETGSAIWLMIMILALLTIVISIAIDTCQKPLNSLLTTRILAVLYKTRDKVKLRFS